MIQSYCIVLINDIYVLNYFKYKCNLIKILTIINKIMPKEEDTIQAQRKKSNSKKFTKKNMRELI